MFHFVQQVVRGVRILAVRLASCDQEKWLPEDTLGHTEALNKRPLNRRAQVAFLGKRQASPGWNGSHKAGARASGAADLATESTSGAAGGEAEARYLQKVNAGSKVLSWGWGLQRCNETHRDWPHAMKRSEGHVRKECKYQGLVLMACRNPAPRLRLGSFLMLGGHWVLRLN